ncbi:MAG: nitrous oxide reductase accessory protein NosL [Saprospiraceae bacterium]|nr:nitrous oxide reductase accessory protein NosL [Saprospiraceae bacterium]
MKNWLLIPLVFGLFAACTPTAEPVAFGEDMCAHCKMTIVDEPFAAEAVSQKGKVYKFDAIECMVEFLKIKQSDEMALMLVRDYENPKDWQDATQCNYLISKDLPSPMGAGLSAWLSKENAEAMKAEKGGEVYDWANLQAQFK